MVDEMNSDSSVKKVIVSARSSLANVAVENIYLRVCGIL